MVIPEKKFRELVGKKQHELYLKLCEIADDAEEPTIPEHLSEQYDTLGQIEDIRVQIQNMTRRRNALEEFLNLNIEEPYADTLIAFAADFLDEMNAIEEPASIANLLAFEGDLGGMAKTIYGLADTYTILEMQGRVRRVKEEESPELEALLERTRKPLHNDLDNIEREAHIALNQAAPKMESYYRPLFIAETNKGTWLAYIVEKQQGGVTQRTDIMVDCLDDEQRMRWTPTYKIFVEDCGNGTHYPLIEQTTPAGNITYVPHTIFFTKEEEDAVADEEPITNVTDIARKRL